MNLNFLRQTLLPNTMAAGMGALAFAAGAASLSFFLVWAMNDWYLESLPAWAYFSFGAVGISLLLHFLLHDRFVTWTSIVTNSAVVGLLLTQAQA